MHATPEACILGPMETAPRLQKTLTVVVPAAATAMAALGVLAYASVDQHDNPYAGGQFAIGLSAVAVGAYVAYRRSDHQLGWILLAAGVCSWATFSSAAVLAWMARHTTWSAAGRVILYGTVWGWIVTRGAFLVLVPLAFPDSVGSSRLRRVHWWLAIAAIAATSAAHGHLWTFEHFAGQPAKGTTRWAESFLPWGHRIIYVLGAAALVGMFVRVSRLSAADRRRYLPFAVSVGALSVPTLNSLYSTAFGRDLWHGSDMLELWTLAVLPVVLAVAVLRHGALDIEVVVRRTTVYVVVIAMAAAAYAAVVGLFSVFIRRGAGPGPVIATALVALGAVPLHAVVERQVSRRLFGHRGEPYQVISTLGARLEQAPAGDEALHLVAATLCEQLRVPYVAVELFGVDAVTVAAAAGRRAEPLERFGIVYRGEPLGWLAVAPRTSRDTFRPGEHRLLDALARQAGVVAHNARLSQALLQSRATLVQAREEERRRVRRDLHDGLGPTLATVSLSLAAAAERLGHDPELETLLRDLEGEVQRAIADIRRLVYDLRPPVLDDLGLVGALRWQAGSLAGGVAIEVETTGSDAGLPSAVELAAYRVAVEAMTNVVRHSAALRCNVVVERDRQLVVRIEDDGIGIAPETPRGVGMRSMRERVMELGGSLRLEARSPSGTLVRAAFPLDGLG